MPDKANFRYAITVDQDIATSTMGMDQDQKVNEMVEYEYEVLKSLPDGAKDMKVTITAVATEQSSPMGGAKYDSRVDQNPQDVTGKIYEKMVGQAFRMTMNADGKVKEVTGADKMLEEMLAAAGFPEGDETSQAFESTLKTQFGNKAMAEDMSMLTAFYPDKPIKPGDTWEKTVTREAGIGMIITTTYKLMSRGKGKAYIDFSSEIASLPDAPPVNFGVMNVEYDLSGQQTGSMIVDEATGWAEESEVHQKFGGDMKISGPELPFGTINGTMEAKSVIRVIRQ